MDSWNRSGCQRPEKPRIVPLYDYNWLHYTFLINLNKVLLITATVGHAYGSPQTEKPTKATSGHDLRSSAQVTHKHSLPCTLANAKYINCKRSGRLTANFYSTAVAICIIECEQWQPSSERNIWQYLWQSNKPSVGTAVPLCYCSLVQLHL